MLWFCAVCVCRFTCMLFFALIPKNQKVDIETTMRSERPSHMHITPATVNVNELWFCDLSEAYNTKID